MFWYHVQLAKFIYFFINLGFLVCSYISIIQKESLEISQPALDMAKSEVHHQITARGRKGKLHRYVIELKICLIEKRGISEGWYLHILF